MPVRLSTTVEEESGCAMNVHKAKDINIHPLQTVANGIRPLNGETGGGKPIPRWFTLFCPTDTYVQSIAVLCSGLSRSICRYLSTSAPFDASPPLSRGTGAALSAHDTVLHSLTHSLTHPSHSSHTTLTPSVGLSVCRSVGLSAVCDVGGCWCGGCAARHAAPRQRGPAGLYMVMRPPCPIGTSHTRAGTASSGCSVACGRELWPPMSFQDDNARTCSTLASQHTRNRPVDRLLTWFEKERLEP